MSFDIDTQNKCISINFKLENWSHVNWLVKMMHQNGGMIWGDAANNKTEEKPSATILKLVKDE